MLSLNYTIPSDNRELQRKRLQCRRWIYYTIPSDNRELQPNSSAEILSSYYTIPSDNRELQPVPHLWFPLTQLYHTK